MSPSGLHVLLRGSKPHPATREKLVKWHLERRATADKARPGAVSAADVDVALRLLKLYVTQDGRESVQERRVREIVRRFEAETGVSVEKNRQPG